MEVREVVMTRRMVCNFDERLADTFVGYPIGLR